MAALFVIRHFGDVRHQMPQHLLSSRAKACAIFGSEVGAYDSDSDSDSDSEK